MTVSALLLRAAEATPLAWVDSRNTRTPAPLIRTCLFRILNAADPTDRGPVHEGNGIMLEAVAVRGGDPVPTHCAMGAKARLDHHYVADSEPRPVAGSSETLGAHVPEIGAASRSGAPSMPSTGGRTAPASTLWRAAGVPLVGFHGLPADGDARFDMLTLPAQPRPRRHGATAGGDTARHSPTSHSPLARRLSVTSQPTVQCTSPAGGAAVERAAASTGRPTSASSAAGHPLLSTMTMEQALAIDVSRRLSAFRVRVHNEGTPRGLPSRLVRATPAAVPAGAISADSSSAGVVDTAAPQRRPLSATSKRRGAYGDQSLQPAPVGHMSTVSLTMDMGHLLAVPSSGGPPPAGVRWQRTLRQ